MTAEKYMDEEKMVKKAVRAIVEAVGPIEASRFITMPRKKRVESVKRHRQWQQTLDKDEFFDRIFKE